MADLALVAGAKVRPASGIANEHVQYTHEAAEGVDPGQVYRLDANGKAVLAASDVAGNAGPELFIAIDGARQAGNAVTGMSSGLLEGFDLEALAFGAQVFLGLAGAVADAAGTVSAPVGRVTSIPYTGTPSGADKVIRVNCPK